MHDGVHESLPFYCNVFRGAGSYDLALQIRRLVRIDLLFDFPIPAAALAEHATRITIRSVTFHGASEADLLRLKKSHAPSAPHRLTPRHRVPGGEALDRGVIRPTGTRTHLINGDGIRPAMHPGWRRCSSFKYSRYSQSSRLASRAPRRPRCCAPIYEMGSRVHRSGTNRGTIATWKFIAPPVWFPGKTVMPCTVDGGRVIKLPARYC
jgi:hypothetical protein